MDPENSEAAPTTEENQEAAPAENQEAAPAAPPTGEQNSEAPQPTVLDTALAVGRSRSSLMAQVRSLNSQNGALQSQVSTLTVERDALQSRITELEAERDQVSEALQTAESEAVTVQEATTQALAAVGVDRETGLPAPDQTGGQGNSLEQRIEAIENEKDPEKAARQSAALWDEMVAKEKAKA